MKLLSIPAFLGLLLLVLYAQSKDEENINVYSERNTTIEYVKLSKKNEVFTTNREENSTVDKDRLKIDIGMDVNTTRDRDVVLTVSIENLNEEEGCNYFWREGKKFLGVGDSISVPFKKGKHRVSVNVKTTSGREINGSKTITAWEYTKEATLFYDEKTGEFTHKKVRTYDHKGNLIQIKGKDFLKTYTYDKNGQEIEMHYDDYTDIEYSSSSSSEYDENGNLLKNESVDADGNVMWSEINEYNEKNETISSKMGENENNLEETVHHGEYNEENEDESIEENDNKYVYDDNGNVLKSEYSYDSTTVSYEMTYNDANQTLTEVRKSKDGNYSYVRSAKYTYDNKGNIATLEKHWGDNDNYSYGIRYKYTYDDKGNIATLESEENENGKVGCHYMTSSSYNAEGYVLKESNKVFSGDCQYDVLHLYVENTYDKEGNIVDTKSKKYTKENEKEIKDEISEIHRTMKTKNYYSNELDD